MLGCFLCLCWWPFFPFSISLFPFSLWSLGVYCMNYTHSSFTSVFLHVTMIIPADRASLCLCACINIFVNCISLSVCMYKYIYIPYHFIVISSIYTATFQIQLLLCCNDLVTDFILSLVPEHHYYRTVTVSTL